MLLFAHWDSSNGGSDTTLVPVDWRGNVIPHLWGFYVPTGVGAGHISDFPVNGNRIEVAIPKGWAIWNPIPVYRRNFLRGSEIISGYHTEGMRRIPEGVPTGEFQTREVYDEMWDEYSFQTVYQFFIDTGGHVLCKARPFGFEWRPSGTGTAREFDKYFLP